MDAQNDADAEKWPGQASNPESDAGADENAETATQNKEGAKEESEEPVWKAGLRVLGGMLWGEGLLSFRTMFRALLYLDVGQQNQPSQPQRQQRRRRVAKDQDVRNKTSKGQGSAPTASWKQKWQLDRPPMPLIQDLDQHRPDMFDFMIAKWDIMDARLDAIEERMATQAAHMEEMREEMDELWESHPDSGYGSQ